MSLYFTNYYLIKDSIKNISPSIINDLNIDNNLLFKYSFFYNSPDFFYLLNPFKKDKYKLNNKIKHSNKLYLFKDLLLEAKENHNKNQILFVYIFILNHYIDIYFDYYINQFINKNNRNYVLKMIDSYIFNKFEKFNISKINIGDYFFNSFDIKDFEIEYVNNTFKKRLGFFECKNYYKNCYRTAQIYFSRYTGSNKGFKKISANLYDVFFNHINEKRKAKTFFYDNKIDTTLLNNQKHFFAFKDTQLNLNLDDFYNFILKELKSIINSLNVYFLNDNINNFLKLIS